MAKGMSPFVFVFYSNALATLIVLFTSLFCHKSVTHKPPPLSFSLVTKFFLLGLTGVAVAQNCAFTALNYASPILACAMGHLLPTFSFLLSIISRNAKLDLRSPSSQAKATGVLITAMGATVVVLYKGPPMRNTSPPSPSLQLRLMQHPLLFASEPEHWALGALFFALASLSVSLWHVIQAGTIKEYSEGMTILSSYSVFGTIQSAVLALIIEREPSAWTLNSRLEITNIALAAIFGSIIRNNIQGWCMRWKGPVYVAMFKPLGIVVAVTMGFIFFGSSLHVGSVVGAIIMGIGYYSLMWGQIKEEEIICEDSSHGTSQSSAHKVPLLQDDSEV
ncbi:hypothetical protein Sjap_016014 [Stephania japonica]|uniref:WAT1-related protein n=1 Tax=Stephania japonica TaxID=461633 RepID=A0AAP0NRF5_9MAGN